MNPVTTHEQLLDRLISDGIAEVRAAYAAPADHHLRDGAVSGFEACRGKTPLELVALWTTTREENHQIRTACQRHQRDSQDYWQSRYKEFQIEFVCNVISAGLINNGQVPLLAHLPTIRGARKYAEIVGTHKQEASL
jgi:hypothetical protein